MPPFTSLLKSLLAGSMYLYQTIFQRSKAPMAAISNSHDCLRRWLKLFRHILTLCAVVNCMAHISTCFFTCFFLGGKPNDSRKFQKHLPHCSPASSSSSGMAGRKPLKLPEATALKGWENPGQDLLEPWVHPVLKRSVARHDIHPPQAYDKMSLRMSRILGYT